MHFTSINVSEHFYLHDSFVHVKSAEANLRERNTQFRLELSIISHNVQQNKWENICYEFDLIKSSCFHHSMDL